MTRFLDRALSAMMWCATVLAGACEVALLVQWHTNLSAWLVAWIAASSGFAALALLVGVRWPRAIPAGLALGLVGPAAVILVNTEYGWIVWTTFGIFIALLATRVYTASRARKASID